MLPRNFLLLLAWPLAANADSLPIIKCPLKNESRYFDIRIEDRTNGTKYCAPVSVRQCRDGSGCVGMKYSKATTTYEMCGEYTNKHGGPNPTLPAIVRIDADPSGGLSEDHDGLAKYLEFVCDPAPGVRADISEEYWPPAFPGWPKALAIDGRSPDAMVSPDEPVCGPHDDICGYTHEGQTTSYCCMRCDARDGYVVNTTVHNRNDYGIKVQYGGTTCSAFDDEASTALIIPPRSTQKLSFPIEVIGLDNGDFKFVPMHRSGAPVCTLEMYGHSGHGGTGESFPKVITLAGPDTIGGLISCSH